VEDTAAYFPNCIILEKLQIVKRTTVQELGRMDTVWAPGIRQMFEVCMYRAVSRNS
jgi:hypothetical protein